LVEASEAFTSGDFGKAAELTEQAYMIEPNPTLLYPWAQAERENGNCETAIDLYKRFLESNPSEGLVEATNGNIARCEEQLAAEELEEDPDLVVDDEPVDAEPIVTAEPQPGPTPTKNDAGPRAWYRDPAGGVLVGVGVAGIGAGAALMGIAGSRAKSVGDEDLNTEYESERSSANKLNTGGVIALSIGGALVVAGVVRWVVLAKKNKSQTAHLPLPLKF
jgi:tetratricopeptide (TPR) repeat protein